MDRPKDGYTKQNEAGSGTGGRDLPYSECRGGVMKTGDCERGGEV